MKRVCHLVLLIVCLASCQSANTSSSNTKKTTDPPASALPPNGTAQMLDVVNAYYQLKDALVATNAAGARAATQKLTAETDSLQYIVSDSTFGGNYETLIPLFDMMRAYADSIRLVQADDVDKMRVYFEEVDNGLFRLLRVTGLKNAGIYRQFCPMALNDKGAFWLSNDRDIRNPYFGNKMLTCGELRDSL